MDGSIDWCCFYYFIRNSPVALPEALFALLHFSRHHWHAVTLPGTGCAPNLCEGVPPGCWCPVDPAALEHCWRTVPDGNVLANRSLPDYCRVAAAASGDTVRSRRPWSTLSGSWHALPDVFGVRWVAVPKEACRMKAWPPAATATTARAAVSTVPAWCCSILLQPWIGSLFSQLACPLSHVCCLAGTSPYSSNSTAVPAHD